MVLIGRRARDQPTLGKEFEIYSVDSKMSSCTIKWEWLRILFPSMELNPQFFFSICVIKEKNKVRCVHRSSLFFFCFLFFVFFLLSFVPPDPGYISRSSEKEKTLSKNTAWMSLRSRSTSEEDSSRLFITLTLVWQQFKKKTNSEFQSVVLRFKFDILFVSEVQLGFFV